MANNNVVDLQKAVIYARYSSHSQTEQSIDGQLRVNYEYAEREGLIVVGEYIDRAISGTSADARPDFQRMIQDAKKHQFEYIIVYKLDRFARNRYDSAIYKHKLREAGVKLLSATENISDNPEGIILEAVLEASAEYYSRELSQKVKRGLRESALKGTFTGGTPPLGYKVVDKKVVIDEEKALAIKFAFEQYAKGVPKKQIVDTLNSKGVRNSKGKELSINSFNHCLKNRKYIGKVSYGGVEYDSTYPQLIDTDTFDKVQAELAKKAQSPASGKAKIRYLLQGKAFCGHCGVRMLGDSGTSMTGVTHSYYTCGSRKRASKSCDKKSEKKDFLEWYVVEQTVEYVLTPERLDFIATRVVEEYDKEFNSDRIKQLEKQIAKLERDADKTFNLIMQSESQSIIKRYEKQIELLDLQKADLDIDLSKLRIANGIRYTKQDIILWLKQFCKGDLMDENFRQRIIDVFINSIYVYDDKIVIYYNINDGKQISYIDNCKTLDDASSTGESNKVRILTPTLRHCRKKSTAVKRLTSFNLSSIIKTKYPFARKAIYDELHYRGLVRI